MNGIVYKNICEWTLRNESKGNLYQVNIFIKNPHKSTDITLIQSQSDDQMEIPWYFDMYYLYTVSETP